MTSTSAPQPLGVNPVPGVVHRLSPHSVDETVVRLTEAANKASAKIFAVIDQDGEARAAELDLRPTKLVLFGNPAAGTPLMQAAPASALDLPLRVVVWADDGGVVWMSFLSASWLVERYVLPSKLAPPLSAPEALTSAVAAS